MRLVGLMIGIAAATIACGAKVGDEGSGGSEGDGSGSDGSTSDGSTSNGSASASSVTTTGADGETGETGDPGACDPSDTDVGPSVSISILNQTDAPLHFTQTLQCAMGVPYSIERAGAPVPWIIEDCVTCYAVASGQCGCPGACAADSVVRIDPGGRWDGAWLGFEAVPAQLLPGCANTSCGDQCTAKEQAVDADYTFSAIATVDVECGMPACDCFDVPDPAGWCSVSGQVSGDPREATVTIAYPNETTVELVFE